MLEKSLGRINSIPTMQIFAGIPTNTQSKSCMLSLTECMSCISKIMHCGLLINMPHCGEVKLWQTDGSAPDEIELEVFYWWNIDSGLFTILVQTCQMDVLPKKWF